MAADGLSSDNGTRLPLSPGGLMNRRILLLTVFLALPLGLRATDWPQWRGPDRNGISQEKGLLQTWPKGGPKLLWTVEDAGIGFSGPAVVGDRLYTMGSDGKMESV